MTFRSRNAYYLRISSNIVLPLFLYLDERHTGWMSDVVLQHILADLRPLIIPKLQAEKDAHFGPGATPGNKRGTVEVHRSENYQFAYFFRKTESHSVVLKSRYFVTALQPCLTDVSPKHSSMPPTKQVPQKKRLRHQAFVSSQSTRKRAKIKGKSRTSQSSLDEDEWTAEENEEDIDDTDFIPREPRPVRRQRRFTIDTYREGDEDEMESTHQEVAVNSPSLGMDGGSSRGACVPAVKERDTSTRDTDDLDPPNPSRDVADIELALEEEEEKPKPLLKLKYQSFPISGHCLCVVAEPWPPLRAETTSQSTSFDGPFQHGNLESPFLSSSGFAIARQRAKTPLFFPEDDRATSEREWGLPPVPLFHDGIPGAEDFYNNDLMNFSQTLNTAGHMHAITADDDDDIEGAILFGDADEVRELF